MMHTLLLDEGDRVTVTSVKLPRATSVKFKPRLYSFTQIQNPKGVLENVLGLRGAPQMSDQFIAKWQGSTT